MHWIFLLPLLPYLFILIFTGRKLFNVLKYENAGAGTVFTTVIIPCRNEEKNILNLLSDLDSQDYPAALFKVIVCDDNSTDNTYQSACTFQGQIKPIVLKNQGIGKKTAILTAVNATDSELIVTVDADCRIGEKWLGTIVSYYISTNADLIIPPVVLGDAPGLFQEMQQLEFLSLQGVTAATAIAGTPVMCNGSNLAFRRETYIENVTNLRFDLPTGDDIFLLQSVKRSGGKIKWLHSSLAKATTAPAISHSAFFRQRARWISKAGAFTDFFTNLVAIVTFLAVVTQVFLTSITLLKTDYLLVWIGCIVLKSIPDLMILYPTVRFHDKMKLLIWFPLSQLLYPFYVLAIVIRSLFETRWKEAS
ncbi:MAG: glycosyltransferase [Bacteroidales bacterium]